MQELRSMDEEFQRHRKAYRKRGRAYLEMLQNDKSLPPTTCLAGFSRSPTTPSPTFTLTAAVNPLSTTTSLELVEKEYKTAIEIQDNKIDKARHMYDLLSSRIEEMDSQIAQNNISFIPTADYDIQQCCYQQKCRHDHFERYSSSSASSAYSHQIARGRSLTSMYTMAMEQTSLHHPRHSASGIPRNK
ncbi:unnamed protein product [Absidia cylindrospora]